MVRYDDLTKKTNAEIETFFVDVFNKRKGTSFKCGDKYYNVIILTNGDYLLSELKLGRGGYVTDATSVMNFITLRSMAKFVSDLANI